LRTLKSRVREGNVPVQPTPPLVATLRQTAPGPPPPQPSADGYICRLIRSRARRLALVANSWGRWNEPPKVWPEDRYGPWPEGSFWVAEDVYERYFVGSRSIFSYCDIRGVPQKQLPDYGNLKDVLG
jgi:hypothetical protein